MINAGLFLQETARRRPEHPALIYGGCTISYGDLHRQAMAAGALFLQERMEPGNRVAIMARNRPMTLIAYYGAVSAGLVPVLINPLLTAPEISNLLDHSGAKGIILYREDPVRPGRSNDISPLYFAADEDCAEADISLQQAIETIAPLSEVYATAPGDSAAMMYTSGTTGAPKGVDLSHLGIYWNSLVFATELLELTPNDRCLCVLPLSHAYAHSCLMNPCMLAGATIVLQERFDVEASVAAMRLHGVTVFMGVPTMFWGLVDAPIPDDDLPHNLRACVSGGQALPEEVHRRFEARYKAGISVGFGQSEATASVTGTRLRGGRKPHSAGSAFWGVSVSIRDPNGQSLPPEEKGEIWVRSPGIMRGYFRNEALTAETITPDLWLKTGDIGFLDEEGDLFVVDRQKDMIIRGGYNIYPSEIEEILYRHEQVLEAVVIGCPDERLGEEIVAYVVPRVASRLTAEELSNFCRERVARYKIPRRIMLVDDLPRTATGKLDKKAVRRWENARAPAE